MNRVEKGNGPFLVNRRSRLQAAGFTLIEMAVVIFIIGLIASMTIAGINARLINASIQATKINQDTIKDALGTYLGNHNRLPCPAINTLGKEGRGTGAPSNCLAYYGLVPYLELGLTKNVAMDGWGNFFSYGVSPQWTATLVSPPTTTTASTTTNPSVAFNVGNLGVITINDRIQSTGSTTPISTFAAAIVISQGANGEGAYTAKGTLNDATTAGSDEKANMPPASFSATAITPPATLGPYYKREYTANPNSYGGAFDDVVMILNPNDLLTPLIKDGVMQSAQGAYATQVANIQDWVASQISASSCAPPGATNIPTNLQVDPWGNIVSGNLGSPFYYSPGSYSSSSPSTVVFTLTNTRPGIAPVRPSGATMLRIYPFLSLATTACP